MTDDGLTGPWLLALGTLAVGVGAVVAAALRRRQGAPVERPPGDEGD